MGDAKMDHERDMNEAPSAARVTPRGAWNILKRAMAADMIDGDHVAFARPRIAPFPRRAPRRRPLSCRSFAAQRERNPETNDARGVGYNDNRARWYDPRTGRFAQNEPRIDLRHRDHYSYAHNSPAMFADPTGRFVAVIAGYEWTLPSAVTLGLIPHVTPGMQPIATLKGALENSAIGNDTRNSPFKLYSWSSYDQIVDDIIRHVVRPNAAPDSWGSIMEHERLILIGWSFGGNAIVKVLVPQLRELGLAVDLAVTIDAIGTGDTAYPPNISAALNFHQQSDLIFPIRGERTITGATNIEVNEDYVLIPGSRRATSTGTKQAMNHLSVAISKSVYQGTHDRIQGMGTYSKNKEIDANWDADKSGGQFVTRWFGDGPQRDAKRKKLVDRAKRL